MANRKYEGFGFNPKYNNGFINPNPKYNNHEFLNPYKKDTKVKIPKTPLYTKEEIAKRLNDLFKRIVYAIGVIDMKTSEDIKYIGYCEGILESTGTLNEKILIKLNKLWKEYKE